MKDLVKLVDKANKGKATVARSVSPTPSSRNSQVSSSRNSLQTAQPVASTAGSEQSISKKVKKQGLTTFSFGILLLPFLLAYVVNG